MFTIKQKINYKYPLINVIILLMGYYSTYAQTEPKTYPAENITTTSALIKGQVHPNSQRLSYAKICYWNSTKKQICINAYPNKFDKETNTSTNIYQEVSQIISGLKPNTCYYYKIRSIQDNVPYDGPTNSFWTRLDSPKSLLYLNGPGKDIVTFYWGALEGALKYDVEFDLLINENEGLKKIFNFTVFDTTTLQIKRDSLPEKVYFWKVRALNEHGWGNWSASVMFRRPW
jgi:hypothetical protein